VNAAPEVQLRLLDLQALDSTLDRLSHRRRTLPELTLIQELSAQLEALEGELVQVMTENTDLSRDQGKLETDVELVRSRMTRDQQRLDTGAVASPRELENLQSEVASLARRQAVLEDEVLALMEQREALAGRSNELTQARDRLAGERADAEQRRDTAFAEIDSEADATTQQRKELAGQLPADLLSLYEKIRDGSSGVGAAALHRGRCEGCHLQLNTVELHEIRDAPPDAVVRCGECRRILVRTAESGL
jgi:predicted  nucleic acid-binding Zn-ribbon protein